MIPKGASITKYTHNSTRNTAAAINVLPAGHTAGFFLFELPHEGA